MIRTAVTLVPIILTAILSTVTTHLTPDPTPAILITILIIVTTLLSTTAVDTRAIILFTVAVRLTRNLITAITPLTHKTSKTSQLTVDSPAKAISTTRSSMRLVTTNRSYHNLLMIVNTTSMIWMEEAPIMIPTRTSLAMKAISIMEMLGPMMNSIIKGEY